MRVDPESGSIGNPQSLNRYAYAHNDVVNLYDPLGLDPIILPPDYGIPEGTCYYFGSYEICHYGTGENGNPGAIGVGKGKKGVQFAPKIAPLPDNLGAEFSKLLAKDNNKCGNFTRDLISQTTKETGKPSYSNNIQELYNAISGLEGGGYVVLQEPLRINNRSAGGTVEGSLGNLIQNQILNYLISSEMKAR